MSAALAFYVVGLTLLFWTLVAYPLLMALFAKRDSRHSARGFKSDTLPMLSVILPVRDEVNFVATRLENLLSQTYPPSKYEILVVTDRRNEAVINEVSKRSDSRVRLVLEVRSRGKVCAINAAVPEARGEILVVTDVNCGFNREALGEIARRFQEPKVGMVGGAFVPLEKRGSNVGGLARYWRVESAVRRGEASLDSACLVHGEIYAWRKGLGTPRETAISDDLDVALSIRAAGYRVDYASEAVAFEPAPNGWRDLILQRRRTAAGTIEAIVAHRRYLFRRIDVYTAFIFPSHRTLPLLSPFLLAALVLALLWYASTDLVGAVLLAAYSGLIFLAGAATLLHSTRASVVSRQSHERSRETSMLKGLASFIQYFLVSELSVLAGWFDFLLARATALWTPTSSNRDTESLERLKTEISQWTESP